MNCMRVSALQTLLLYARCIDTNAECTRMICDEWLELRFLEAETAQKILSIVLILRTSFEKLFRIRLEHRTKKFNRLEQDSTAEIPEEEEEKEDSHDMLTSGLKRAKNLENLLKRKLAEFADSSVYYAIRRVMPVELNTIYVKKFAKDETQGEENVNETKKEVLKKFNISGEEAFDPKENEIKGGYRITEYLTYNWYFNLFN